MGSGMRSSQNCARCSNHGLVVPLKGHKRECLFRDCTCSKCQATRDRQKYIAEEIANHRREDRTVSFDETESIVDSPAAAPIYEEISDDNLSQSIADSLTPPQTHAETRKEQHCSRCRNHGILQMLKGHKVFCPFRICRCRKCEVTTRRREVMARHVRDTRDRDSKSTSSTVTSSMLYGVERNLVDNNSPPTCDASSFCIQQFVDYGPGAAEELEPEINDDLFFMIQSLFEKYACQGDVEKVQLVRAFTELANFDWQNIESALEKGELENEIEPD